MMREIKTKGLVLSSIDYKDNIKLLNVYLLGHGVETVSVRGINNPKSPNKVAILPLSFGDYHIKKSKVGYSLSSFVLGNTFYSQTFNIENYLAKNIFIEILEKYTRIKTKQDNLALLVLNALKSLCIDIEDTEKLVLFFLVRLCRIIGISIDFKKDLLEKQINLTSRGKKQIEYLATHAQEDLKKIDSTKVLVTETLEYVREHIRYYLDVNILSIKEYIKEVSRKDRQK